MELHFQRADGSVCGVVQKVIERGLRPQKPTNGNQMTKQQQRILQFLTSGKTLTRLISWRELGILECPVRISELRDLGYDIRTNRVTVINRYGESFSIEEWTGGARR